jgi:hypothetical protein
MDNFNASLFCQFVCATIVHLTNAESVQRCLKMMKFTLNHPYQFSEPFNAFLVIYIKFTINILVEFSVILVILSEYAPLAIVMNFIAIFIVD